MDKKKKIIIVTVILIIAIIVFCFLKKNNSFYVSSSESDKFENEYESLNGKLSSDDKEYPKVNISDNNIKYITLNETLKILDNGTGVIYIGYAECLYCRTAVQVLVDTANKSKLEEIYYLDISKYWDVKITKDDKIKTIKEADKKYNILLEKLVKGYIGDGIDENYMVEDYMLKNKSGKQIKTGTKRIKVPLVLFVVNGNVVSSNVGTLFSHDDPYKKLDKDQIKGLTWIYKHGIQDVLEEINNKG